MIQDVISLITPTDPSMKDHYLAPATPGATNPNITFVAPWTQENTQDIVYCKGFVTKSGAIIGDPSKASATDPVIGLGPWDWMTATGAWIRQKMTERIWTNLATGKLESVSGLGVRRLPRFIITDPTGFCSFSWTMTRPETDYLIIDPPASGSPYPTITKNTDSGVRCTFRGPYLAASIDNLPAGFDWIEDYEWSGHLVNGVMIYDTLERVTHRQGFGRYMWQAFAGDGKGGYSPSPSAQSQQTIIMPMRSGLQPIQNVF